MLLVVWFPLTTDAGRSELEDVLHAVNPNNNDSVDFALSAKTIAYLEVEALEKEEKQQHGMCVRLVRDKLTACGRRSDILLQQLQFFAKSKKNTTALFDKLEATEVEVEKLECELARGFGVKGVRSPYEDVGEETLYGTGGKH